MSGSIDRNSTCAAIVIAVRSDPLALDDVIAIAREGAAIAADEALLARAREQFAQHSVLVLRGFLTPRLLAWTQALVRAGSFSHRVHPASGEEDCMQHNEAIWLLRFIIGSHEVLRAVERLTDHRPLTNAELRVYRFEEGTGHHHDWHDDVRDGRRLGLSVNLSEGIFEGGNLQLRDSDSFRLLADVVNTGAGDAVIFRLGDDVEHRVLPVTSGARVALAGWFRE
jgi:hypothetical protein